MLIFVRIVGSQPPDGGPEHLARGVAEDPFRTMIPTADDAVQILADDGVVGRFHDRREQRGGDLGVLPQRDVADVAEDLFASADLIHIADKLHGNAAAVLRDQRQIFIPNVAFRLQSREHDAVAFAVLWRAEVPDRPADDLRVRKAQQLDQERVRIVDASGLAIEDQDAIARRFEEPAILQLRVIDRLLAPGFGLLASRLRLAPSAFRCPSRPGFLGARLGLFRSRLRFAGPGFRLLDPGLRLVDPRFRVLRPRLGLFRDSAPFASSVRTSARSVRSSARSVRSSARSTRAAACSISAAGSGSSGGSRDSSGKMGGSSSMA